METLQLSDAEAELIHAICNYKRAYPNTTVETEWYIQNLYDSLMDIQT